MNNKSPVSNKYIEKLEKLEKELLKLKKVAGFGLPQKLVSLKGILKGIQISEKEIEKAKKSLFKEVKI